MIIIQAFNHSQIKTWHNPKTLKRSKKELPRWGGTFDIDKKMQEISEEEELTHQPEFWNNPKKAELIFKSINDKKYWTKAYDEVINALEELKIYHHFFVRSEATEDELDQHYNEALTLVEDIEFKNMLSGEEDKLGAILHINPGAGGTESQVGRNAHAYVYPLGRTEWI